ncbi:alpha/beta-hydrolase [Auricularia subglabra TFB-10046 SS5]|nr:alpha/beta-hydrolase [Auricularia subglabra TFB-10046 SS5]
MPTVALDSGAVFAYVDSGAPPNQSDYATIVILHGLGFDSNTFRPLFPLAASAALRIVCVNRRGYRGSSPAAEKQALADQGTELAAAVAKLAEELQLGKLGLLAWSLGNVWLHALLDSASGLGGRLTHVVLLDPASQGLGVPDPAGSYNAFKDASYPPGDLLKYVSGYYAHPAGGALEDRTWLADPAPTVERLPLVDVLGPMDEGAAAAPEFQGLLYDLARRALKGRTVHVLIGERTLWSCIFAVRVLEEWAKDAESGIHVRTTTLPGCNHFPMWDHPDLLIEKLVEVFKSESTRK